MIFFIYSDMKDTYGDGVFKKKMDKENCEIKDERSVDTFSESARKYF